MLLLGGAGRSGSTLLERMLDQVPGVTALGEVLHLWERGLAGDELCGCGRTFAACPFWSEVGVRAFDGWASLDAAEQVRLRHEVVRTRYAPSLLGLPTSPRRRLLRGRLARASSRLYAAAEQVAGSRLLVDSSKHPAYALLLRRVRVDLRCVLVVRDPRAVAHSWRRTVRRPEVVDRDEAMPRYSVAYTALTWVLSAVIYEGLRAVGVPVLVSRYEDLVARPEHELRRVLDFAGIAVGADGVPVEGDTVDLAASHTVGGQPDAVHDRPAAAAPRRRVADRAAGRRPPPGGVAHRTAAPALRLPLSPGQIPRPRLFAACTIRSAETSPLATSSAA